MNYLSQIPKLEKWARYHNTLVGRAYNHPDFENGQRVQTNHVAVIDQKFGFAKCSGDEMWQLGQPGTLGMYEDPITKKFY